MLPHQESVIGISGQLADVRRLYWQYQFNRISIKQLMQAYRSILNALAASKLASGKKFADLRLGSLTANLLTEFDRVNEEALHAITRNDVECARIKLAQALKYPLLMENLIVVAERFSQAKLRFSDMTKNSVLWPMANQMHESAIKIIQYDIPQDLTDYHKSITELRVLTLVIDIIMSSSIVIDHECGSNITEEDVSQLNERIKDQLTRLTSLVRS